MQLWPAFMEDATANAVLQVYAWLDAPDAFGKRHRLGSCGYVLKAARGTSCMLSQAGGISDTLGDMQSTTCLHRS